MATVEERLSSLEARVDAHATGLNDLRQAVVSLEVRMDGRFDAVDRRFDAVDRRFGILESQIARLTTIVVMALTAMLAIAAGALFR